MEKKLLSFWLIILNLWSLSTSQNNCSEPAKHYEFLPEKVIKILSNQHVVFLGDSLMRYHYLSLVYILRFGHVLLPFMKPNLVNEHEWDSWPFFLRSSTEILSPYCHCDCFRNELLDAWENRYYYDPTHNISLTYIMFQLDTVRGAWFPPYWRNHPPPPSVSLSKHFDSSHQFFLSEVPGISFDPYHFNSSGGDLFLPHHIKPSWDYYVNDTILNIIQYLLPKPNLLVVNIGIWHTSYASQLEDLYRAAMKVFPMILWKKTAARRNPREDHKQRVYYNQYDNFMCAKDHVFCQDFGWTHGLGEDCFLDGSHFVPSVYWRIIDENLNLLQHILSLEKIRKSSKFHINNE